MTGLVVAVAEVERREHLLHFLNGAEEVGEFGGREVCEALDGAVGDDEDVAWDDGFVVYERVTEGGVPEDLFIGVREVLIGIGVGG